MNNIESTEPITITAAVVQINPEANVEVISFYNEALRLQKYAETRVIATADDLKPAVDDLSIIKRVKFALEEKRKDYLAPFQEHTKTINDAFKTLMFPILEADRITRDKMLAFDIEQKRIRREQEEINRLRMEAAQKDAALHNGEISEPVNLVEVSPEAPKRIHTEMGTSGVATIWKFEVIDFSLLPDRFKMENATLIGKVVRAGEREIPGVRIWSEDTLRVTAR